MTRLSGEFQIFNVKFSRIRVVSADYSRVDNDIGPTIVLITRTLKSEVLFNLTMLLATHIE